jgi:hypothetical protein
MLPKGLKQMLVASENLFFNEASGAAAMSPGNVGHDRAGFWQPAVKRFDSGELSVEA